VGRRVSSRVIIARMPEELRWYTGCSVCVFDVFNVRFATRGRERKRHRLRSFGLGILKSLF